MEITICKNCNKPFHLVLEIPDYLWDKIKPIKGVLCGQCVMQRLEEIEPEFKEPLVCGIQKVPFT